MVKEGVKTLFTEFTEESSTDQEHSDVSYIYEEEDYLMQGDSDTRELAEQLKASESLVRK